MVSSVHITCNKDDYICYFILFFGISLFIIAMTMLVKFAYDSTKRQRLTNPQIINEQNRRVFQVVLNMMNENGVQAPSNVCRSTTQTPLYTPITPQVVTPNVPQQDCSCQMPPTYEECMSFGAVQEIEQSLGSIVSKRV